MSDIVEHVAKVVMIDEECGCFFRAKGKETRVLCDDESLSFRQKKCNCRNSAKAAIRATLEFYRDNASELMPTIHEAVARGVFAKAVALLDQETV